MDFVDFLLSGGVRVRRDGRVAVTSTRNGEIPVITINGNIRPTHPDYYNKVNSEYFDLSNKVSNKTIDNVRIEMWKQIVDAVNIEIEYNSGDYLEDIDILIEDIK